MRETEAQSGSSYGSVTRSIYCSAFVSRRTGWQTTKASLAKRTRRVRARGLNLAEGFGVTAVWVDVGSADSLAQSLVAIQKAAALIIYSPCLRLPALPLALTPEASESYALPASRSGLGRHFADSDRDARQARSSNQALDVREPEEAAEIRPPAIAPVSSDRRRQAAQFWCASERADHHIRLLVRSRGTKAAMSSAR